ncbi:MAG: hypothetical protein ACXVNO_10730 [Bacteroidia bacterium]
MKILKYIIIFILLVTLSTCKKYPEGGWTNVAIKHLFGGKESQSSKTWKLKLYEVNGIDSTAYITAGNGVTNFQNDEVIFKITTARYKDYFIKSVVFEQGIALSKDKRYITTLNPNINQCLTSTFCERNIFSPEAETNLYKWKIIKLINSELIITGNFKNSYKIILKH